MLPIRVSQRLKVKYQVICTNIFGKKERKIKVLLAPERPLTWAEPFLWTVFVNNKKVELQLQPASHCQGASWPGWFGIKADHFSFLVSCFLPSAPWTLYSSYPSYLLWLCMLMILWGNQSSSMSRPVPPRPPWRPAPFAMCLARRQLYLVVVGSGGALT